MSALPEMPCQEFVERVTEYLDGALSDDDRQRLEAHLSECSHCAGYLEQLRIALRLSGRLREADVTAPMKTELMSAFARWRDER